MQIISNILKAVIEYWPLDIETYEAERETRDDDGSGTSLSENALDIIMKLQLRHSIELIQTIYNRSFC